MPYPDWTAGTKISGERLRAGQAVEALKTADQNSTNTTLQDDSELFVQVVGGATYRGVLTLYYLAPTGNDLDYAWSAPFGSTGRRGLIGPDPTTTASVDLTAMQSRVSGALDTEFTLGGAGGSHKVAAERFILLAGTDGTLQLRWAQATAGGTSTVLTYSHLALQRMS